MKANAADLYDFKDIKCVLNTLSIIKTSVIKAYIKMIYQHNSLYIHKSI